MEVAVVVRNHDLSEYCEVVRGRIELYPLRIHSVELNTIVGAVVQVSQVDPDVVGSRLQHYWRKKAVVLRVFVVNALAEFVSAVPITVVALTVIPPIVYLVVFQHAIVVIVFSTPPSCVFIRPVAVIVTRLRLVGGYVYPLACGIIPDRYLDRVVTRSAHELDIRRYGIEVSRGILLGEECLNPYLTGPGKDRDLEFENVPRIRTVPFSLSIYTRFFGVNIPL